MDYGGNVVQAGGREGAGRSGRQISGDLRSQLFSGNISVFSLVNLQFYSLGISEFISCKFMALILRNI